MMKNTNNLKEMLVLGGTGKTGSRIVQRLQQQQFPVRIGSRSAQIPFDWEKEETWQPVLEGIENVYVSFQPDLAAPGAVAIINRFVETAVKAGVKKLVLLSGRGEPEAQECEEIVTGSGLDWTIIRASWFFQNFSEGYLLGDLLAGYVTLPTGDTPEPFVDADDIADVAVAALTGTDHAEKLYEVTGPRLLTFKEAVQEIATATKRTIIYHQVTGEDYTAMLNEHGVPKEYISLLSYLFSEVLDGRNASIANGVEQALHRKPSDFSAFIQKAIEHGSWQG